MKKYKYIAIAAIIVLLVIVSVAIVWSYERPKSPITVYNEGEKVGTTGFYFAGVSYIGLNNTKLSAIFMPTTNGTSGNLEPTQLAVDLNLNGNTTASIGNEPYTIVSYSLAKQTVSMAYG